MWPLTALIAAVQSRFFGGEGGKWLKNFIYSEFKFSKKLLVIGVKPEKLLSVGEKPREVRLEFGAVEKKREVFESWVSLPLFNNVISPDSRTSRKIQD